MNKRLERVLSKDADRALALLLIWELLSSEEKRELTGEMTFEEAQWIWENALPGSKEKSEMWDLSLSKAETFNHYQWIWENALSDSKEKSEMWDLLLSKAETFNHYLWIWENALPDSKEKSEMWDLVEAKADIPKDLWLLWRNFPEGSIKKSMAFELLKMHDDFSCEFFLHEWRESSLHDSKKNDALKLFKARAKNEGIEHLCSIWRNRSKGGQEREIIWESIKENVFDFEDFYQLYESYDPPYNDDFDFHQYGEILQRIKHKAKSFEDAKKVWEHTENGTPERDEAMKMVMKKSKTFNDWLFTWENLSPNDPERSRALLFLKITSGRESQQEIDEKIRRARLKKS